MGPLRHRSAAGSRHGGAFGLTLGDRHTARRSSTPARTRTLTSDSLITPALESLLIPCYSLPTPTRSHSAPASTSTSVNSGQKPRKSGGAKKSGTKIAGLEPGQGRAPARRSKPLTRRKDGYAGAWLGARHLRAYSHADPRFSPPDSRGFSPPTTTRQGQRGSGIAQRSVSTFRAISGRCMLRVEH
jgi:hypothetical protein